MQQFIEIEVVNQFGNNVVRPLCAIGETFAAIAGTYTGSKATLSRHTLWRTQDLGYTLVYGPNHNQDQRSPFIGVASVEATTHGRKPHVHDNQRSSPRLADRTTR